MNIYPLTPAGRESALIEASGDYSRLLYDTKGIRVTPATAIKNVVPDANTAVTVSYFGAIGDGVQDDTDALTAAFYLGVQTGRPVLMEPKKYLVSKPININLADKRLFIKAGGATVTTATADAFSPYVCFFDITGSAQSQIGIESLTIEANQAGNYSTSRSRGNMVGLGLNGVGNVILRDVVSKNFGFAGVWIYYADTALIENCSAINCKYVGLLMQSCTDVNVSGGVYSYNGGTNGSTVEGYGVSCGTKYSSQDRNNSRIVIDGLTCANNVGKGIDAHNCIGLSVTKNHIYGFGYHGIYAVNEGGSKSVADVNINGNFIDGSSSPSLDGACIGIYAGAYGAASYTGDVKISGNTVKNISMSSNSNIGILISNGSSGYAPDSVIVSGNCLMNAGKDGASPASVIKISNDAIPVKSLIVSENIIYQSEACTNGILGGPAATSVFSGNVITTTSSFVNGIYPDPSSACVVYGNVLKGSFSSASIAVFQDTKQITRANVVNGSVMRDVIYAGSSIDFGASPPASGYYTAGSVRFNSAPASGQAKGWRCVASGSPGTWVSEGSL